MSTAEPIVIWGAGAIGGTIGAHWARAGIPVLLVDIVAEHVEACRTSGLRITGPIEEFTQVIPAVTPAELTGKYKRIILAVKAQATEAALDALVPHLAEDGFIFSAQNGLNEIAISERVGAKRTMGCFVNFGADWHGPGEILYGNRGALVIGELDGQMTPRALEMHRLGLIFEPASVLTDNIWGYLWGKLAYGAMLFGTALTDDSMSANFADPQRLGVWLELGREVGAVAAARGVKSLGFGEFDPMVFAPGQPEYPQIETIAWLADYTSKTAKTHSGIWRDLAVRKRKTEVDPQIGIIAKLGREAGVPTPTIETLVELIHEVEDGKRPLSFDTLKVLIDQCNLASTTA
ncbi:2-dehydropantoate 2-reductase N-terminal domain-containing protein [Bosea sp. BK604]|uniref:ketopantoate reductase family protein n=1 Tax=Bosea sp. BK604 TaxID=2512180 RepID=UPI00104B6301|nr:2-dehydropantoate 2-reductase N-terminal domain-containing protein [Bosea sp. BK604]TCR68329.1 ketopantoate reductase [Bosea sp. BK604]